MVARRAVTVRYDAAPRFPASRVTGPLRLCPVRGGGVRHHSRHQRGKTPHAACRRRADGQAGQRAIILSETEKLQPLVRAEPGCIDRGPCAGIAGGPELLHRLGPGRLAPLERWGSLAAPGDDAESAPMADGRTRIAGALLSRDVRVLQSA